MSEKQIKRSRKQAELEQQNKIEQAFPKKEEGKLNIYMHVAENSGVGYYREYLPAVKLRESGLAQVLISDFRFGEGNHVVPTHQMLFDIARWADLIVVGRQDVGEFYAEWGGIKEFFNIPIVLDTDDNVHFVRPQNPGYMGYHPGSEALAWNRYATNKIFDAITVTTQDLKDFYTKDNPRIYILPNSLDVKLWDSIVPKKREDNSIRFGFIGSAAHSEGMRIVIKPVLKIMKKYPNTRFVVTHVYKNFFENYPQEIKNRIEYAPWIKLQDWQQGLKDLHLDIGLAPLADNMFNRAKSNLRWLEYSLIPVPTIASPIKPYLCIKDGFNGIIAREKEDWFIALERLVVDEKLRHTISKNAYDTVAKEFNIDLNIKSWENTYKEIHDRFHDFFGPKKVFAKVGNGQYQQLKPGWTEQV